MFTAALSASLALFVAAAPGDEPRCEASVELASLRQRPSLLAAAAAGSGAAATAFYEDSLLTSGWGVFEVFTEPTAPDADQAYAAGYLEGFLTGPQTANMYANMWRFFFANKAGNLSSVGIVLTGEPGPLPALQYDWLSKQYLWAKERSSRPTRDPFWLQSNLILQQFDGQVAGYRDFLAAQPHPCKDAATWALEAEAAAEATGSADPWEVATLLNAVGDMIDINAVLEDATAPNDFEGMSDWLFQRGLCTAVFKVLPDLSDILMGHTSWFTYSATNRIYKHYHINTMPEHTAASSLSFSSYPGFLESLDDFYLLSSGLVMIQTSLSVLDPVVHGQATNEALLAWQRVRIAHALSHTGEEWYLNLRRENSGTYNNEYMILDTKKFVPGEPLQPGLFWVVEQVPGLVEGNDATSILEYGYFPSFNIPFFKNVWTRAGYAERFAASKDSSLTHALAPRAQIFRRDHATVTDIDGLIRLLRSNDYLEDPLSRGGPTNAICARGDLRVAHSGPAAGCYDVKATRVELARSLTSVAKNGPTRGTGDKLPGFKWADFSAQPHLGLPASYEFPLRTMRPEWRDGPRAMPSKPLPFLGVVPKEFI